MLVGVQVYGPHASHLYHLFNTFKNESKVTYWYWRRSNRETFLHDHLKN